MADMLTHGGNIQGLGMTALHVDADYAALITRWSMPGAAVSLAGETMCYFSRIQAVASLA